MSLIPLPKLTVDHLFPLDVYEFCCLFVLWTIVGFFLVSYFSSLLHRFPPMLKVHVLALNNDLYSSH
jgi:hypothetical protein